MRNGSKPRVLYIVYWGASEPLGRSLVLPGVKRLADLGSVVTLITFEKPADMARHEDIAGIRIGLDEHGVEWIPLSYHKKPKVPATAYDMLRGCVEGIASRFRSRVDIIHARTFVGGLVGLAIARLIGAKLIFHNEGFYPDEQVDGGVWKENSAPHRIARFLERQMYSRADGIIAVSHRGKRVIESLPEVQRNRTPLVVVPSCVDLAHFRMKQPDLRDGADTLRLVYIGSVGCRYVLDKAGRFASIVSQETGPVHLRVLSHSEPALVSSMLRRSGLADDEWSFDTVPNALMPNELATQHAGLFFLAQGLSEHGCSPTKIGEYWAAGLPVVTTPNVSDTDEIIRRERVGVIVEGHSDDDYRRAALELRSLLDDKQLSLRCRRAAESHYALQPACERQLALYHNLLSREPQSAIQADASELGNF